MNKLKRKHLINFQEAPGNFWYLVWIGKIYFTKKQHKVKLYFINCFTNNDQNLNYDQFEVVKVSTSYLSEYKLGVIYSVKDKALITYKLSKFCQNTFVNINIQLNPAKYIFPLIKNSNFQKIIAEEDLDLKYYVYSISRTKDLSKKIFALVTPYTILQYYLLKTDKLIKNLFSINFLNCFKFNTENFYLEKDTNKKVIELYYNEAELSKSEAELIAPFFFMKNNLGLKFINSIHSNIVESLKSKTEKSCYPNISFGFSNFDISLKTKLYPNINDDIIYYLANEINSIHIKEQDLFNIDKILLLPFIDKSSTKDRKNHKELDVTRPSINIINEGFLLNLQQDSTNNRPSISESLSQETYINPFNIEIEKINRETQLNAYNVTTTSIDTTVSECIRDFISYQEKEDIIKEQIELILLGNYDYFKELIKFLKGNKELKINDDPLNKGKGNYPTKFQNTLIDIIEIEYKRNIIYLIEFGSGLIGVFSSINKKEISSNSLSLLINKFLNEHSNVDKNKFFWTYLCDNKADLFATEFRVNIITGVEHSRSNIIENENETSLNYAIKKTAERIYYRIKNNL